MGKQLWIEDDHEEQFDKYHPGCISGILHALDWPSNVKKMLAHRKHDGLIRRDKRIKSIKRRLNEHDSFEVHKLLDAETSHFFVDQSTRKPSSTNKRSLKARSKALVYEEISKEADHKKQIPGYPTGPRLLRTYSIHHLEPSDLGDGKISNTWGHPISNFHDDATLKDPSQLAEDHTIPQEKSEKVTESSVNQAKEIRQNASDSEIKEYVNILELFKVNKELFLNILQNTDNQHVSDTKGRLTKSGSFPATHLPRGKNFRPSKLKYKQNDTWAPKLGSSKSDKQEGKKLDVPLEDIKQIINCVVREGKDESNCQQSNSSAYDLNNGKFTHIRRISSLSESTQRLYPSRSLKLTSESEISSSATAPIFFRRIHSLPHLDDYGFSHNQESHVVGNCENVKSDSHDDTNPSALPVSESSTRGEYSACSTVRITDVRTSKTDEVFEDMIGLAIGKSSDEKEYGISTEIASSILPQSNPVLVPEYCSEEVRSHTELQVLEGLDGRCNHVNENESAGNSLNDSDENANKNVKNHKLIKLYVEDDDDFTFVREILELSGFITDGFQETWYSSNQPLNPAMFQELESRYVHKPECFEEDLIILLRHLLIFDLVDEVLLQMHESSFTYYPKALSSACHIRTIPIGHHLLKEVWKNVSRWKPKMNQSLDFVASQDLGIDDGWMNLQLESECVALELEDLILDELLEEVFCS